MSTIHGQRRKVDGFIALPLVAYVAFGALVIILAMGIALKAQSSRLEACKAEYAAFRSEVDRLGKEAKQKAKAQEKKQHEVTKSVRRDLDRALERMRDEHSRSVPAAPEHPEVVSGPTAKLRLSCAIREQYATEDAIRLYEIQRWLVQQGFPIE